MLGEEICVTDLSAHPEIGPVPEDGSTFEENARIKAKIVSRPVARPGAGGRFRTGSRFVRRSAWRLLRSLRRSRARRMRPIAKSCSRKWSVWPRMRRGRRDFAVCWRWRATVKSSRPSRASWKGKWCGRSAARLALVTIRYFSLTGFEKTFAELSAAEKNAISHRAVAVAKLRNFLRTANL